MSDILSQKDARILALQVMVADRDAQIERLTRERDEAFRLRYCAEDDAEIVKEQYDALLKNSAVKIDAAERKVEKLREALVGLNAAIDAFWNDSSRPAIHTFSARGIEEWQVRSCAALTETEKGDE